MVPFPTKERAARYVRVRDDETAACRVCERDFPDYDGALAHVEGLVAMNAMMDHCRIHGFDDFLRERRTARLSTLKSATPTLEDAADRRRRGIFDLFTRR